ncbi:WXG100 family type VII secretion target [Saccharopolyspora shandongensis]|uniref:WXG100 family type VII secretion target n=1 Tax=Saccharopolyspora shandongensis TaxID=418495 RepID=UPI003410AFA5
MREPTNFSAYSHGQLYAMLQRGDDSSVRPAADSWDSVGAALHEQAGNLEAKLAKFQDQWRGGASEQYRVMINDLSGGLRRIGDAAFAIRDRVHDSADALAKARTEMPPAVEVADLPAETARLATTPLEVDQSASPAAVAQLRQRQADAAKAVQEHQQATAAADAAHAKAITVMTELGGKYRAADQGMPLADQTEVPDAPAPGDGAGEGGGTGGHDGSGGETGEPAPGQGQPEPEPGTEPRTPLFGNMFTAGLAAASAAGMGRLGGFRPPKVPEWGKPKDPADKEKDEGTPVGMPRGGMPGLGGGASLGGGAAVPAPTAAAGLSGLAAAPNAMGAAGVLGAAAGAVNAAGSGAGGMPMMPMMPFAPGGQDMSGARRIPPWLVETEEVWGESSVITPSVLGAEPPDQRSL